MRVVRLTSIWTAVFALLALAAASAGARGDGNRDRIPDRWERHHHLSLSVNQARRDQDHDGLKNRGEFKAHMNPRDADSDNDGIEDGDENAGTITEFSDGVLTIGLAGGGSVSGKVTDETRIKCEHHPDDSATTSHHGSDDGPGDDGNDHPGEHNGEQHDPGQHGQGDEHGLCTVNDLVVGTTVEEAELKIRSTGPVFKKVELEGATGPKS